MLVLSRVVHDLRDFRLGDLVGEHAALAHAIVMHMQHDLRRLLRVLVEERLQDRDHELHRRVIVVQQQDAVHVRALGLSARARDDGGAVARRIAVRAAARARRPPSSGAGSTVGARARGKQETRQKRHSRPESAEKRMRLGDHVLTLYRPWRATPRRGRARRSGTAQTHLGAAYPRRQRPTRQRGRIANLPRAAQEARDNKKGPAKTPALGIVPTQRARSERCRAATIIWPDARESGLDRLERLGRELHEDLVDLGRLGDEALVGGLGVFGLDLDRGLDRLGAEQLLDDLGIGGERLLGIIGRLGGNFLKALGHRGGDGVHGFQLLLAEFLEVFEVRRGRGHG